ncbi:6786_t:CDS:1, partial [Entrophospora sp. SA101]
IKLSRGSETFHINTQASSGMKTSYGRSKHCDSSKKTVKESAVSS